MKYLLKGQTLPAFLTYNALALSALSICNADGIVLAQVAKPQPAKPQVAKAQPLKPQAAQTTGARKDAAPDATPAQPAKHAGVLRYHLVEGSENWPAGKKEEIVAAMEEAVAFYNGLGHFDKEMNVSYNESVPTADGNYNGNIRFGKQISTRTALHEIAHVLGVGQAPNWSGMKVDGQWTGKNAVAQLREFDGPGAVLTPDGAHFYPYGLNYAHEDSPDARRRHVLMVAALRADMGLNGDEPFVLAKEPLSLRYRLTDGSDKWPTGKRTQIVAAMDEAVAFYNSIGNFDRQIVASYNPDVPMADGNYNGNIRFGKQISARTALHEIGHILGIGTVGNWQSFIIDGKWTGQNALAQLREFDGPDAVLNADRQHFWPYGLNYANEDGAEARRRHILMVKAFRADLGLNGEEPFVVAPAAAVAPAELIGRDFLTIAGERWRLAFSDEFNGDKLDETKWSIGLPWGGTDGTGRHHNEHYASYIMDDDVAVRDGALHLTTQRRPVTDKLGNKYDFTEGLITTSGKFDSSYGYFEMRAKMPVEAGPGTWPAFWTLSQGWPPEFDIVEYWGSNNRIHQGTVTRKPDGGQRWESHNAYNTSISGWHTYGLEWGPGYQQYNIDGVITNSIYGEHLAMKDRHYLLLNSGVESDRKPVAATKFPNDFEVDYARVYSRPFMQLALHDGGFEMDEIGPWKRTGEAAVVDYGAKYGTRALRIAGDDKAGAMSQTVYGLKPKTRYRATAEIKNVSGSAQLVARDFGGSAVKDGPEVTEVKAEVTKSGDYQFVIIEFYTGAEATSVTLACEATGMAFFDDVQLKY